MTDWQATSLDDVKGLTSFLPQALMSVSAKRYPVQADEARSTSEATFEGAVSKRQVVKHKVARVAVSADHVNLRRDPGRKADIIARASFKDEAFPFLAHQAGWVQPNLHGAIGWVTESSASIISE